MYLQDVFTEEEYKKIVEDISQRKVFETKYFNFNKARFTIGMIPTSYLDLWPEGVMVSIGADKPTSGHGVGETPKRMLEIFESYEDAFKRYYEVLSVCFKENPKWIPNDLWIVWIRKDNKIMQFEQLLWNTRCKLIDSGLTETKE